MTTYYSSTVTHALILAIKTRRETEKGFGYTMPSAVLACWEQMLKEIQAGEQIHLRFD